MAKLYAGFSAARIGDLTISVTDSSAISYTAELTGSYAHVSLTSLVPDGGYAAFAASLEAALESAAATAGSAITWTVTYSTSSMAYTIGQFGGASFSVTGMSAAMAQVLGESLSPSPFPVTGTSYQPSDFRPWYVIDPRINAHSESSGDYEASGMAWDGEADDGSAYGISVEAMPLYYDWTQMFETQAATFSHYASSAVPWTYQHLIQHARNIEPVYWAGDYSDSVCVQLRAESARFAPRRVTSDYDGEFNIRFLTRVLGR